MSRFLIPLAWIGAIAFCLGCWWFLYDLLNTVGVFEALANLAEVMR